MKRIFLPILLGVLMISAVLPVGSRFLLAMMFLADRENRR